MSELEKPLLAPLPQTMNYRDRMISAGMGIREKLYIQPTNGSSKSDGNNFSEFHIPGNRSNTFADLKNLYVSFNLLALDGGDGEFSLENAGVANCVERIELDTSSGVHIANYTGKAVYDSLKMFEDWDLDAFINSGAALMGTGSTISAVSGVGLSRTIAREFVLPIIHSSINTMVPLFSNDGLRIRIHWATPSQYLVRNAGTAAYATLSATLSSISMHYDTVKVRPDEMAALFEEYDGRFVITGTDVMHQSEQMNSTSLNSNLGFGRSKCQRILITSRPVANAANTDAGIIMKTHTYSLSTLTNAELRFNGRLINEQMFSFAPAADAGGGCAIILAEAMKSNGGSFINPGLQNSSVANYGTAAAGATYNSIGGTWFMRWDLSNGVDTHLSQSGLDARTGTFQLALTASSDPASQIDIFCEYENKLVLDMKTDRVFRVQS